PPPQAKPLPVAAALPEPGALPVSQVIEHQAPVEEPSKLPAEVPQKKLPTVPLPKRVVVAESVARSTLGRFVVGPRPTTAEMERRLAVFPAHPDQPTGAIARKMATKKPTVPAPGRMLKTKPGKTPDGGEDQSIPLIKRSMFGRFMPAPRVAQKWERAKAAV